MAVDNLTRVAFEPCKPLVGSIVHAKREDLFDPQVFAQIRKELDERVVLVFPQVHLTNEEQVALTDMFGKRQILGSSKDDEDVYAVTLDRKLNRAPEYVMGTFFYHIDGLTAPAALPYATLLTSRRLAAKGGQTEFASTDAAYCALSDAEKEEFEQLTVNHTVESSLRMILDWIPERYKRHLNLDWAQQRPLVYTRASGRKSLLLGSTADTVEGMDVPRSRALLARLQEYAAQPDFTYRHEWQEGDLAIWVNPAAMHRVIPYDDDSGRMMHRTVVAEA